MLQSEYDVIVKNKRLKILLIILTALMIGVVLFVTIKFGRDSLSTTTSIPPKETENLLKSSPEPTKTDFGTATPTDFPTDIPIEKGVTPTQSYTLDYPGEKQLSIVFPSMKTVKENYALYSGYAKKEGWMVVNTEEKDSLSFLYATKENTDMNVTIMEESTSTSFTKSQVSIGVLKK